MAFRWFSQVAQIFTGSLSVTCLMVNPTLLVVLHEAKPMLSELTEHKLKLS